MSFVTSLVEIHLHKMTKKEPFTKTNKVFKLIFIKNLQQFETCGKI